MTFNFSQHPICSAAGFFCRQAGNLTFFCLPLNRWDVCFKEIEMEIIVIILIGFLFGQVLGYVAFLLMLQLGWIEQFCLWLFEKLESK